MKPIKLVYNVPYTAEQMYALVADVSEYPQFLPYCSNVLIEKEVQETDVLKKMQVAVTVVYKSLSETYTSDVSLNEMDYMIHIKQIRGFFFQLEGSWKFKNLDSGSMIYFSIEVDVKTALLVMAMKPIINRLIKEMLSAFEKRANVLYQGQIL